MARRNGRRGGRSSGEDGFEGRDLLVGRPEQTAASGGADAGPGATPEQTISQVAGAHDDAIREILGTVREILEAVREGVARKDTLGATRERTNEATAALDQAKAKLAQVVEDARGVLAEAAELAAGRDGEAAAAARVLVEGAAELTAQGEALDQRLDVTGQQAQAATQALEKMISAATALESRLRFLSDSIAREIRDRRWRRWLKGLTVATAAIAVFVLGAVMQRETLIFTFGDPRHQWNAHVVEHYAQMLATCATKARHDQAEVKCLVPVDPSPSVTIPLYAGTTYGRGSAEGAFDPATKR